MQDCVAKQAAVMLAALLLITVLTVSSLAQDAVVPAVSPASPVADPAPAPATAQVTDQVTRDGLDDLKKRVEASADLTDAQKQTALDQIERAKASLSQAAELTEKRKLWQQQTQTIEADRRTAQAALDAALQQPQQRPAAETPLPELEQTLATKQQQLVQVQTELAQVEKRLADRAARQKAMKERLQVLPMELDQVSAELSRLDTSTEPPLLVETQRKRALADRKKLENEPATLQAESTFLNAQESANLIQLDRQLRTANVARLKDEVSEWQRDVLRKRSSEAKDRAALARSFAESAQFPQLRQIYSENAETVEQEIEIRDKQKKLADELAGTKAMEAALDRRKEELVARETKLGNSTSFAIRLREQRKFLPPVASLQQQIRDRISVIQKTQLELMESQEQVGRLENINETIKQTFQQVLALAEGTGSDEERQELFEEIRDAYAQRQNYLSQLQNAYDTYASALDDLDAEQALLINKIVDFQKYIDERILWVPTHSVLTLRDITPNVDSFRHLLDRQEWKRIWSSIKGDAFRRTPLYAFASLIWLALLLTQKRQRRGIRETGQKASSRLNTAMKPTFESLGWTLIKSLVFPFPFLFLGWRGSFPGSGFQELAGYFFTIAAWLWWLEFMRFACRPFGLGISHFQWPARIDEIVSRQLSSFLVIASPLVFLVAILRSSATDGGTDALERTGSILFFLLVAWILHRLTSRKTGILCDWIEKYPGGWLDRLAVVWHALAVFAPLALAGLTIAGYTYTVNRLTARLAQTLMLVAAAIIVRSLLVRWLTLRQRRLAIAQAREVRAAMAESPGEVEGPGQATLEAQEARTNLADISSQSKRLINTTVVIVSLIVLWFIWVDVLPALQLLDTVLIPQTKISLKMLLTASLELILFATAARNIPGLLEITLLERLPLDRSVRYAIGALTRYLIVVIGTLAFGQSLGYEWKDVQWLVAALTFGLGFGLQEIFANFVSGLIILFEQPVRVGDIVTIDSVTGTVSRIRIRSTTITDWDRKEYIVPNKEFITGRLLNWTLNDTTNRIVIEVGAPFSSDPNQVRSILQQIIKTQPHILAEPAPGVSLEGFGVSSLKFVVRAYLPSLEHRTETVHMLHVRIHRAFAEAGIEIPYPQQDLHIRSLVPVPTSNGTPLRTSVRDDIHAEAEHL
jgi:potassium efflux system protein